MGWDGAGGYTRQHNFSADASSGVKILAARMDAELDDVASAMTIAWARNGQNVPTQDIPMGGRKFINVGAATSVGNYMRVREFIENVPIFMQDQESSADRISVSAQYFTSVSANQAPGDATRIFVRANSNKSSAVLYLNGHSANVHYADGGRIASAVTSGGIYEFIYSSVDTAWKVLNPDTIDATIKYVRTAAETAAGVTPTSFQYPPGDVRRYGAVGDGTTDDTTAIQNALNSGHKHIFGDPTHTYLVSFTNTTTINSVAYRYCLSVPQGVVFDLRGATLKLDDAENAALVAMLADDASLDRAVLDGNRANQTSPATGEMACILAYDVDRIRVRDVRAKNVRQYAARFLNCRASVFYNLHCEDSYGDGWSFGTSGAVALECIDSFIDEIYAEDCEGTYSGLEGNGCILTVQQCQIGRVHVKDCAGAIKLQNTSSETTADSLMFDGDDQTYGSANSGVKLQGASGSSVYPARVVVNSIVSRDCYGNGLVIDDIESLQIGSYSGTNNGSGSGATGSEQNDVEVNLSNGLNANAVQIAQMCSDSPTAIGVRFQGNGNVSVGSIVVRNPTGRAVQSTMTGRLAVRHILALDDQGTPTMTFAFSSTGICTGRVDLIETNLTHDTSQSRVALADDQHDFEIGVIRLGSTDTIGGTVQLTNGATSTSVTCGHIWRDFVGTGGGFNNYLHPILDVQPWDTSAKALSGNFGYTVTDGSSGTGFTITHPSAGAADYVRWKLLGWAVTNQASS